MKRRIHLQLHARDLTTAPAAFVRDCLGLRQGPDGVEALRASARSLADAWPAIRELVRAERLGPLMHDTAGVRGILPPPLAAACQRDYWRTAMRNRLLLRELATGLRALAEAKVPTIVLKGAALAATVYRDAALRPMIDADLLVPATDRARACAVLATLGYTVARAEPRPGAFLEHENEITLRKPGPRAASIDLHWTLFDSPHYQRGVAMDWFWDTATSVEVAGEPTQILGPEAQLLHLCGHLALHHAGRGLLWWQDVVELLAADADSIDWPLVLARAQENDLQLPLQMVLIELAARWGALVPPAVLADLRRVQPSSDEAWLFGQLGTERPSVRRRFWTDFVSMSGWSDRRRFALAILFPSTSYIRQRYRVRHRWLVPFYYPYRWLRAARRMMGGNSLGTSAR